MTSVVIRLGVMGVLLTLLTAKFLLPAPVQQITLAAMDANFKKTLEQAGANIVFHGKRNDRADHYQSLFTLRDCPSLYLAIQAATLEDLDSVLELAEPVPEGLVPHIFYLGRELDYTDRLGLKWTAVSQFVLYRLGLSSEMPSGDLYIVLAKPGCDGYRGLEWWRVWTG
jgi:hypothetical protein